MAYVDFNKKDCNRLDYINIVQNLLRKNCSGYLDRLHYSDELVDYIVDYMERTEGNYEPDRGSMSTFRYQMFMSATARFYKNMNRRPEFGKSSVSVEKLDLYYTTFIKDLIDSGERKRIYDIAMDIISRRKEYDVKYLCFWESVIEGRTNVSIAKELGITKTWVGEHIKYVRRQLQNELVNVQNADLCEL